MASSSSGDDIDPCIDQFRCILRHQIDVLPRCAKFDREILAFNETAASQFVQKLHVYRRIARNQYQKAQTIGPPRLLRQRSERPCDTCAQKRDKLAPPHRFPRAETGSAPFR